MDPKLNQNHVLFLKASSSLYIVSNYYYLLYLIAIPATVYNINTILFLFFFLPTDQIFQKKNP